MKFLLLIFITAIAMFAQTTTSAPKPPQTSSAPKPSPAHPATPQHTAPAPDEGTINGHSYSSDYFGFQYTFPDTLDPEEDFMQGREDQEHRSFVLLAAYGESEGTAGRQGVVIWADQLKSPAANDLSAYLAQVTNDVLKPQQYEPLGTPANETIAGRRFIRGNFRKNDVYESVLVTIARGYTINFLFTGPSQEQVNNLATSLNTLRFAPAKPAVLANPKAAPPKPKP